LLGEAGGSCPKGFLQDFDASFTVVRSDTKRPIILPVRLDSCEVEDVDPPFSLHPQMANNIKQLL
jgi:hypothetical protein